MTGQLAYRANRAVQAVFCAVFAALLWAGAAAAQDDSARDRGILQAFLEDNLSGAGRTVRIEGFQGALSGRATIEELTIADADGVWLTLRRAVLDWNRGALLSGRLEVAELSAEELLIPRAPRAEPSPPSPTAGGGFALPELPVSVDIEDLSLDRVDIGADLFGQAAVVALEGNASLSGGEGAAELRLSRTDGPDGRFELTGSYANETRILALSLLVDEGPDGIAANLMDLPGKPSLNLRVTGEDPIDDFRAEIALATDGTERLAGLVELITTQADDIEGDTAEPTRRIQASLSGDIAPVFAPQYRPFFGPEIALSVDAAQLPDGRQVLETFDLRARAIELTGTGEIAADGWPERFSLTGRVADPDGSDVQMPFGEGGTRVGRADLQLSYDRASGDRWQLQAEARDAVQNDTRLDLLRLSADGRIVPPQAGRAGLTDGALQVDARGLALPDAALAQAVGDTVAAQLQFAWETGAPLSISGLRLAGADYGLTGDLRLRLPDGALDLLAALDLRLDAQDLGRFAALAGMPLSGAAGMRISGDVTPVAGEIDLTFDGTTRDLAIGQPRLDPLLEGEGRLRMEVSRDTTGSAVRGLSIATDHARITADATLGSDAGNFDITAALTDTARVQPGLTGPSRLTANGRGTGDDWDVTAKAELPGDATVDWQGRISDVTDAARLNGRADIRAGDLSPYSTLAGRPLGGTVSAGADVDIALATLSGSIDIDASSRNLSIGQTQADQLLRGDATLRMAVARDRDGLVSIDDLRLRTPALSLDADGELTEAGQKLTAALRLTDGGIFAQELAGPVRVDGSASRGSGDWKLGVTGTAAGGTTLAASGSLAPDFSRADLSLTGRAPLALANDRLRPRAISGIAAYDLRLSGPLALSSLSGRISTSDARLALPDLNLALEGIDTQVTLASGRAQVAASAAVSSGGRLDLNGSLGLSSPFSADLRVAVQNVGLREARLYETSANGEITVNGPLTGGARIAGVLDLGPAELRVPASSGVGYAGLPGLRHVNEPAAVRQVRQWAGIIAQPDSGASGGPAYPVDLTIRAPSRIFVRGRGIDAELGGQLRLLGTTAELVPQGRFELVRGRIDILGQRLTLDEGLLRLQGSFDAFIRFSAVTQAEDVTITVAIEGPASAPKLALTSSPELPEDEVLSQLLFKRDLTEISALQAIRLANALAILSGRGGIDVTARLRQSLALDDLDVGTDAEGNVEARAGKYLSENLYSDVIVNGGGETDIRLNLELNPSFTVRGRLGSDGDTGVGIYFERDY